MKRKRFPITSTPSAMPAKPLFPDDPKSSAALPHNFVNPQGEEIGPADYFLNYSGLTGKNLEAALASAGLEPIKDMGGAIVGAASKHLLKSSKFGGTGVLPAGSTANMDPQNIAIDIGVHPGDMIFQVCERAEHEASATGRVVHFTFNGVSVYVAPGKTSMQILMEWEKARQEAPLYKPLPISMVIPGSMGVVTTTATISAADWNVTLPESWKPKLNYEPTRKDPEVLSFNHKRKIELEKE